jgi:hypothetical protein
MPSAQSVATSPRNAQGTQDARTKGMLRSVKARARRRRLHNVLMMLREVERIKRESRP